MSPEYVIRTWSHKYSGHWLVIRVTDRRIMTSSPLPLACLKWVDVWGNVLADKHGPELSPELTL